MSCDRRNPLVRGGTAQSGRRLAAFDPLHFRIDDRDLGDLVVYGRDHAALLHFTVPGLSAADPRDSWLPFFARDPVSTLAVIAHLPVGDAVRRRSQIEDGLRTASHPGAIRRAVLELFHLPMLLLRELDRELRELPAGHAFAAVVERLLASRAGAFRGWISVYKRVVADAVWLDDAAISGSDAAPSRIGSLERRFPDALSTVTLASFLGPAVFPGGWTAFFAATEVDPLELAGGSTGEQARSLLAYNLFGGAINALLEMFERVRREAQRAFVQALATSEHEPAYSLYLAFLKVFERHRGALNDLTRRHRDHYYRDVLRVAERGAEPDRVHLVLEPPRSAPPRRIEKGTPFDGGKDAEGRDIRFRLDEDLVLGQGRVARVAGLWTAGNAAGCRVPRSADRANVRDDDTLARWKPFGASADSRPARIGFALADPILFAREGSRTFTVVIETAESLPAGVALPTSLFRARLTGPAGWIEDATTTTSLTPSGRIEVTIALTGEFPPVVAHDPELHGEVPAARHPVLEIVLDADPDRIGAGYEALQGVRIEKASLSLEAKDLRDVRVQNDYGLVDTSKPFDLFGPMPAINSSFYVGSSEALSKPLTELRIAMTYERPYSNRDYFLPVDGDQYKLDAHQLVAGSWLPAGGSHPLFVATLLDVLTQYVMIGNLGYMDTTIPDRSIRVRSNTAEALTGAPGTSAVATTAGDDTSPPITYASAIVVEPEMHDPAGPIEQTLENPLYDASARDGFLRFRLVGGDFGHREYPVELSRALIEAAKDGTGDGGGALPKPPYTPRATSLSIGYMTKTREPAQIWELSAFGAREIPDDAVEAAHLVRNDGYRGELMIGVAKLDPPARLSLLFRVLDGSSSPERSPARLRWDYLGRDGWIELLDRHVDDRTRSLTTTGIVSIAVPADAVAGSPVMSVQPPVDEPLHWIRVSTEGPRDAVAEVHEVLAQGVSATYALEGGTPDRVRTPVPPGTITRAKPSVPAIKGVRQPDPSFGGRPSETADELAQRVSERLRHKGRAVTIWDYERLILEAFPEISRVKCINHTRLERDAQGDVVADNELRPGSVLVVPIPYVDPDTGNPRRPYVRRETLGRIDAFLRRRISPFVHLEVQNPRIEEIRIRLDVRFTSEIADITFYREQLAVAVRSYLTPWARREEHGIAFGGRCHKSSVVDFVEGLPYVSHVANVEMYHRPDIRVPDGAWSEIDLETVQATTARSILVAHAHHDIRHLEAS